MNLLQIRQWFVKESGLYDLVVDTTTWADNGADNYINSGQRMLDRLQTTSKSLGRNFQMVEAGAISVQFRECRAIKEVWITDIESGRTRLEKVGMAELREDYSQLIGVTQARPTQYTPAVLRAAPELHLTDISDIQAYIDYMDVMYDAHYSYNGIIFFPPTDKQYAVETWAYFYSTPLTIDTHESYWSVNHPELLVMAAQCVVEKFNRNTEGVKDWTEAIKQELIGIEYDLIEEESVDIVQIGG